jgi:predicted transcriptional regulator
MVMKELVEKYGVRKIDASEKMELTPAAISQYFKGERGNLLLEEVAHSEDAMKLISQLSESLMQEETSTESTIEKTCEICSKLIAEGIICKLHEKDLPSLKEHKCVGCHINI